jgi:transposase
MRAEAVMALLGDEVLEFLSATTHADFKVHKLKGAVLFKLLVYSLLTQREASLRVLEGVFNSYGFQRTAGIPLETKTRFNSIRDRLATIDPLYFKTLFDHAVTTYSKLLTAEQQRLVRFDSTMVAVSAQLLHFGIKAGEKTTKRQVKFTIGFDGLLPCSAKAFTHKRYTSENRALAEAILEASCASRDMVVFDRGLQNRHTLCTLAERGLLFVTRLKTDARLEVLTCTKVSRQKSDPLATVRLEGDCTVHLFGRSGKVLQPFRLIKARIKKTKQPIWFLTNVTTLPATAIAALYKKRWDIEVFFKFIKQERHVKHILVRTAGAIESMLYVTLIAAILLLVYKKINQQKGYKLVRLRFAQELEEDLIKQVVLLCGGDPAKMYHAP